MSQEIKRHPNHVGIIMDGNSRWAAKNMLEKYLGHKKGVETAKKIVQAALNLNIRNLTLYAFSTENWGRPVDEIEWLIKLLEVYIESERETLIKNGIRLQVIGNLAKLPIRLQSAIEKITDITSTNTKMNLYIAFSYGGNQEIVDACKKMLKSGIEPDELTIENFHTFLYAPEMPPIDLVIRTGGMKRISNFLLWHIAYSELHFVDKYWPDFKTKDFESAVLSFQSEKRTFGGRK